MEADQLKHLVVVLTHINDATVDWAEVAKERGISRKDNALTSFKQMIKKHGIEYNNKNFNLIADFDPVANGAPSVATKPKKPRTPRKRRAEDESDETKEEGASPTKKQKVKKAAELINKESKGVDTSEGIMGESE